MQDRPVFTVESLVGAYYSTAPNPENPAQKVSFGTSGHRGGSFSGSFNEAHILAITQAVCEHRKTAGVTGPLYIGKDTHALSAPALETALEVLAANEVDVRVQSGEAATPTPVISRAILAHNAAKSGGTADGIVVTPSHNPPQDGGFKYNEPHGGPADTGVTGWVEKRANSLLAGKNSEVKRLANPRKSPHVREEDFIRPYVEDLAEIIDMRAIAASNLRLGADPLGGSSLPFWQPVAETYGLNLSLVNPNLDPLFSFMPPDHDGKIRMDCSSPMSMAGLIRLAGDYDIAFGNDPDADRHGIVTPEGLMNPNHYLCAAVWYLLQYRKDWPASAMVGKTAVTTSLLDRIAASFGRKVYETPVGFKWFVPGLQDGSLVFGGEESAGASFLRKNGKVWTTDKDGILLNLLAAEMTAVTGKNPARIYADLAERFGSPAYARVDAAATAEQKTALKNLKAEAVTQKELAGSPITEVLTHAPGNKAAIGGLKIVTRDGWFAARPSGTEDLYKIYAESFKGHEHLKQLQEGARDLVSMAFSK